MRRPFFQAFHRPDHSIPASLTRAGLVAGLTLILTNLPNTSAYAADESEPAPLQETAGERILSKSEIFLSAQAAYDAGRYNEAALLYGRLVSNGVDNVEVHYNRANASFREGDLPSAVLHYRNAWYMAPRDPDIRANLHFALNAAGAIEPAPNLRERVFTSLSESEWIMLATLSYTAFIFLLILSLFMRFSRKLAVKMVLLPTLLILLSTGGWLRWRQLASNPEWVVTDSNATALFGPIDGSTAHYKVPLGALVKQCGTDTKGWIEIEYDGKNGWLKETHIKRVSP